MTTSLQFCSLISCAICWIVWVWRLKNPKLCMIDRFWKSKVLFTWTKYTLGLRIYFRSSSLKIICCAKSTCNTVESPLLLIQKSIHSLFFEIAYLILLAYSYPTYAPTSPSFFFLVLLTSSFSSTLRLMSVGDPTKRVQFYISFWSIAKPSIIKGTVWLSATSVAK